MVLSNGAILRNNPTSSSIQTLHRRKPQRPYTQHVSSNSPLLSTLDIEDESDSDDVTFSSDSDDEDREDDDRDNEDEIDGQNDMDMDGRLRDSDSDLESLDDGAESPVADDDGNDDYGPLGRVINGGSRIDCDGGTMLHLSPLQSFVAEIEEVLCG